MERIGNVGAGSGESQRAIASLNPREMGMLLKLLAYIGQGPLVGSGRRPFVEVRPLSQPGFLVLVQMKQMALLGQDFGVFIEEGESILTTSLSGTTKLV